MKRAIALASFFAIGGSVAWSQPRIVAVVNSASFEPGLPSGGALATVICTGINNVEPGLFTAPGTPPLPLDLGRLGVEVNFWPAPILAVSIPPRGAPGYTQINFQVPLERNATLRAGGTDVGGVLLVTVRGSGVAGLTPAPGGGRGGFYKDADGFAVARHASDEGLVTVQHPARPGETIIVYGNDFFAVWPPPPMGLPVPEEPLFAYRTHLGYEHLYLQEYPTPVDVPPGITGSFTKTPAVRITFRGLAKRQIGVQEIHFVVPANQQAGDWALFFNSGSCPDRGGPCSTSGFSSPYAKLPVR